VYTFSQRFFIHIFSLNIFPAELTFFSQLDSTQHYLLISIFSIFVFIIIILYYYIIILYNISIFVIFVIVIIICSLVYFSCKETDSKTVTVTAPVDSP
jgi:hypothetical protein